MNRPICLDLFCGAGGMAVGLDKSGFRVIGVDINLQPRYPFEFCQGDAMSVLHALAGESKGIVLNGNPLHLRDIAVIHVSPPCQGYSTVSGRALKGKPNRYPLLIPEVRELLEVIGLPYVIENVPNAPLQNAITLCGSMFGLDVRRHRLFESNVTLVAPECRHDLQLPRFRTLDSRRKGKLSCVVGVHGHLNYAGEFELRCKAMGIDWMTNKELSQAIPPAYGEFIGKQMMDALQQPSLLEVA